MEARLAGAGERTVVGGIRSSCFAAEGSHLAEDSLAVADNRLVEGNRLVEDSHLVVGGNRLAAVAAGRPSCRP
jgi:hypothetical protein